MIIRSMHNEDIPILEALNKKYYPEFESPAFTDKDYFTRFVIEDSDRQLVMGGGLRYLAETILVTDKSRNVHTLGASLLQALEHAKRTCQMRHIELLHAFVKNEGYQKHLIEHGFQVREGTPLYLWVPNGK